MKRRGIRNVVPRTKFCAEDCLTFGFTGSAAETVVGAGVSVVGGAYGGGASPASTSTGWLAGSGMAVVSTSTDAFVVVVVVVVVASAGVGVFGLTLTPGVT